MKYIPSPVKTTQISLPEEILELTELLAKNIHENWSLQRLSEGWKVGNKRDDLNKEHPDLVPYEELPENEKEYDRVTATETLKTIIVLGYKISRIEI